MDKEYKSKMEEMSDEELKERLKESMELDLKKILRPVPYLGKEEIVEYRTNELIGRCPVTGYPDYYDLTIRYVPDKIMPELKTLKFYFMSYIDVPIPHEHLGTKIYDDFNSVVKPKKLYIRMVTSVRGGIHTTVERGERI